MGGARFSPSLEAAGLERGFRICEAPRTSVRADVDLLLLRALSDIVSPLGSLEGACWPTLPLLLRHGDNISAAGRELRPHNPESGRRKVTRDRTKLLDLARVVLHRAVRIGRKKPPGYEVLGRIVQAHRAGMRGAPGILSGQAFQILRKMLVEIGRDLVEVPSLEPFGWTFIRASAGLNVPP